MSRSTKVWEPSKIKFLAQYINGYPFKPADWSDRGRPIIRIQNLSNPDADQNYFEGEISAAYLVKRGDLLLSWSATLGAYEWPGPDGWLNQHIFKVVLHDNKVSKRYFRWLADWFMRELDSEAHGSTMQHLTKDRFGGFKVELPSPHLQETISNYLDREIARIDKLIAEKDHMLALLAEKRAALIRLVVTQGLNPVAPLKDSGQEWLGMIPAHWLMPRSKGLFREVDDRTETGEETLLSLRIGKGLVPHKEVSIKKLDPDDLIGFKKIEVGQMVINRMRAASGLIAVATEPGLVSPDYAVFEVTDQALSIDYFLELFKTSLLQAVFRSSSKGLGTGEQGFLRLYTDSFLALHFPYPPIDEQYAIAAFIRQKCSESRHMESLLLSSIELAKERRSALITAAVTGQTPVEEMNK
jgi:type I restriction enzyme S subunit